MSSLQLQGWHLVEVVEVAHGKSPQPQWGAGHWPWREVPPRRHWLWRMNHHAPWGLVLSCVSSEIQSLKPRSYWMLESTLPMRDLRWEQTRKKITNFKQTGGSHHRASTFCPWEHRSSGSQVIRWLGERETRMWNSHGSSLPWAEGGQALLMCNLCPSLFQLLWFINLHRGTHSRRRLILCGPGAYSGVFTLLFTPPWADSRLLSRHP